MWDSLKKNLHSLNESKLLLGITMLILNVGSKYIEIKFSKTQEDALRNGLGREILIFAIIFMATHDIIMSILMTAAFIILSDYLFNEKSKLCIIPAHLKRISAAIDTNKDGIVSPEEEQKALEILRKADEQKKKYTQSKYTSYMNSFSS